MFRYVAEVRTYIPPSVHDRVSDLPPFPGSLIITDDYLSPTTVGDMNEAGISGQATKKLAPNLFPKDRYIGHVAALKCYLEVGGEIPEIFRVLQFRQEPWLEKYISFNTSRRQESTTKFQRNYFKLMNNR